MKPSFPWWAGIQWPSRSVRSRRVRRIFAAPERWAVAEAEDRPVFAGAFARLYAAEGVEAAGPAVSSGSRGPGRMDRFSGFADEGICRGRS